MLYPPLLLDCIALYPVLMSVSTELISEPVKVSCVSTELLVYTRCGLVGYTSSRGMTYFLYTTVSSLLNNSKQQPCSVNIIRERSDKDLAVQ